MIYFIKRTKIPQEGKINGLILVQVTTALPYEMTLYPALNDDQLNALRIEKDNIVNTLDALRDLFNFRKFLSVGIGKFC